MFMANNVAGSSGAGGATSAGSAAAAASKWADKRIFTTGEAAEICKVSQQTIIRCFDAGRLGGFRVPGSKFRRIPRADLLRFMQDNEIPTEILHPTTGPKRVLVVDDDPAIVELFQDMLGRDQRFLVKVARNGYDAGLLTEGFRPHVIVLDYMLPDINGHIVCKRIRDNPDLSGTKILIVSGVVNAAEVENLLRSGADDFVKKPFTLQHIVDRISNMAGVA
ncbi:MAG: response regulator [Phycisphaerales bacterium]|jgi:excisionase family DNA binding protein|nr:response regulator [Phycisphaeraceae bacterium]